MAEQVENSASEAKKKELKPELIRLVAEKVYELWLCDLAIERERSLTGRK